MLATLSTATSPPSGFSMTNLIGALVFVLLFWLFQRWLRQRVSTRRRERWAREEGRSPEALDEQRPGSDGMNGTAGANGANGANGAHGSGGPDASGPDASGPEDPTRR